MSKYNKYSYHCKKKTSQHFTKGNKNYLYEYKNNNALPEYKQLRICPFNPYHKVKATRFLLHKENCPDRIKLGYIQCHYNPSHFIHKDSIKEHENTCPDRVKIDPKLAEEMYEYNQKQKEERERERILSIDSTKWIFVGIANEIGNCESSILSDIDDDKEASKTDSGKSVKDIIKEIDKAPLQQKENNCDCDIELSDIEVDF